MWSYHPELLARAVPRYTSYPTAAEFGDTVGPRDMADALAGVDPDAPVSLYLHIPYCRSICWYCGCNTGAANRTGRLEAYMTALDTEIALLTERVGDVRIGSIAFGGGSPNAIAPALFEALVAHLRRAFRCEAPVLSIEIDPRGFDADWAAVLGATGVSRVSLGVQTLDVQVQAAIGRVQPVADIQRSVTLLRAVGVASINFDLMYGLPGQTEASVLATLRDSIAMGPDRLAVFGYAHVPALVPRQRRIDATALADAEARFAQAALAYEVLTDAGYVAVGFDHFARPDDALARASVTGTLRRNFQGFTADPAQTLIGLGASAISDFPGALLQNEKNSGRYGMRIDAGGFATARGLRRTTEDRVRGRAIESILTRGIADLTAIADIDAIRAQLLAFEHHGLVAWQGTVLHLATDALPYARTIASALDLYRPTAPGRFSSAV
ncbi:oxygen-independent coproporphyrinogen III oxidase [Sphingomonas montana]|uniref:oxygen-independent coproporphyrinogen III oxidase n=1 Tax=Sphingomonas montana TaxID=1843236 RepID=UPI00096EF4A1|nr:oxygen-independent coproporphyrinogen III oxidase [Sphingomonas montana]